MWPETAALWDGRPSSRLQPMYPHDPRVSCQINRQLCGSILPPLMIRALGAGPDEQEEASFYFVQAAVPVHVQLRPSCTQSQFTRPILFNPRIMQRLITFSMDCWHAAPRSLAEAVAVVACPPWANTVSAEVDCKSSVTTET